MPPKSGRGEYPRAFKPPQRVDATPSVENSSTGVTKTNTRDTVASTTNDFDVISESSSNESEPQPARSNEDEHPISPKLLLRIMHEHFKHDDTKITSEAMAIMVKYFEIFIKEAIARANFERDDTNATNGATSSFLEVNY